MAKGYEDLKRKVKATVKGTPADADIKKVLDSLPTYKKKKKKKAPKWLSV